MSHYLLENLDVSLFKREGRRSPVGICRYAGSGRESCEQSACFVRECTRRVASSGGHKPGSGLSLSETANYIFEPEIRLNSPNKRHFSALYPTKKAPKNFALFT